MHKYKVFVKKFFDCANIGEGMIFLNSLKTKGSKKKFQAGPIFLKIPNKPCSKDQLDPSSIAGHHYKFVLTSEVGISHSTQQHLLQIACTQSYCPASPGKEKTKCG